MLEMKTQFKTVIAMAIVLALSCPVDNSLANEQSGAAEPDLESAVAAAARFSLALARGDSATAARLLAPDAVILESGDRETRAQYIAGHLGADINFARSVISTRTVTDAHREGEVAWVTAISVSKGRFRDRDVNSRGAELIVLSRTSATWTIRAIHRSSHRVQQ